MSSSIVPGAGTVAVRPRARQAARKGDRASAAAALQTFAVSLPARRGSAAMESVKALKAKLAKNRSASKQLAAKMAALENRAEVSCGPPVASVRMQAVALHIYAMADFDLGAPLAYLRSKGRKADAAELQAWHSALGVERQGELRSQPTGTPAKLRQWAEAQRFVKEFRTVLWVKAQNKKSVAPSPGVILSHAAAAGGLPGKRGSRYRWLQRVMARWGGRKGIFASGDQLSREAFENKALIDLQSYPRLAFSHFPRHPQAGRLAALAWGPFACLKLGGLTSGRQADQFWGPRGVEKNEPRWHPQGQPSGQGVLEVVELFVCCQR